MTDKDDSMRCCGPSPVEPEVPVDDSPAVKEVIGKAADVPEGTKKMFEVRGRKILVINDDGKYFAINGLCSHYNYPLDNGIYSKGRIRCPLHGACFNVKTGDIEDYPGFDSLHSFQVTKSGEDLVIHTTEKRLESDRRIRKAPKNTKICNDNPIVVIGSGPAASNFIEHSRLNGLITPITLITDDSAPPYDRVLLSKNPAAPLDYTRLRKDEFYVENHVNIKLNSKVTSVDTDKRTITTANGETINYSKLVIATGGNVRKLAVPGKDLKGIHYLRTADDAAGIAADSAGKHVVCIGASFIGMEIAAALSASAASVTVLSSSKEPLPVFGEDVGAVVRKRFEAKGVVIKGSAQAAEILGDTSVTGVKLADGTEIPADVVIAGIGVLPATEFLKTSKISTDSRGFIPVDKQFRTNVDFVYAIGDVTAAPLPVFGHERLNIQHFQTAQTHGQYLGYTIVGKPIPRPIVPFFWSVFFLEFGVRFAGSSVGSTESITHGNIEELNFSRYFFNKEGNVTAVLNGGPNPTSIHFLEMWQKGKTISKADVEKNTNDDWSSYLA